MTVWEYAELFRERWRMIAFGVLLGLVVATGVVLLSPRIYESHVTIFISAQSAGDPAAAADSGELTAQRMETYIQLITSDRIAGEVARDLGLNTTGAELAERVSASTEPDTVLITGTVTDSDPERASQVANVLAARFMDHVAELEQPADITVPPPIAAKVFEAAVPAIQPISPRPAPILAIGALLGLFAGLGLAVLRALLDTSVTTRRRLAEVVGAPVLGALLPTGPAAAGRLVMRDDRKGPQAEAFREVRANLRLVDRDAEHPHRVILVTSAGPGEGRTTTACNLAFATAAAGARVLLIDADLRRPRVAAVFGLDGRPGLTDLLAERVREDEVVHRCEDRLDIVPSGPVPPDPGEMLASPPMHTLLAGVRDRYDVVLLDGPPLRPVADALTLTATADGVVLVVRYGSKAERLQAAREALDTASAGLLGAVMTDVPPKVMRGDRSDAAYLGAAAGESSSSSGSDPTAERGSGRPDDGVAEPAGDGRAGDESPGDPRRAGSAR